MIHSYYIEYLKSFRSFISGHFPSISHFQFNYSDQSILSYDLYNQTVYEFPTCTINMTDIRVDDNAAYFRQIANAYTDDTIQVLCNNYTTNNSVVMDFKWVTIQMQVKIVTNSPIDLINFHNYFLTMFPKNFYFYAYQYNSFINIDPAVSSWDKSDDTEGLYYKMEYNQLHGYSLYSVSPLMKINDVTKNKGIDGESSIYVDVEVYMKAPNMVGTSTFNNKIVNGIQIVLNDMNDSKLPILIDMDDNIYNDIKTKNIILLSRDSINVPSKTLLIPEELKESLINNHLALYLRDDVTLEPCNIRTEFIQLDYYTGSDTIKFTYDLSTFNFNSNSLIELYVF